MARPYEDFSLWKGRVSTHSAAPFLQVPPMFQALCWDESALDLGLLIVWGESGVTVPTGKPVRHVGGQFGEARPEEGLAKDRSRGL